jgi:lipid-A-disaccharide synthase
VSGAAHTVLLVAGEPSGDGHGAELILALKRLHPGVRCIGVGGPRMKAAGQEQMYDLSAHAVVGLVEVIKHYPQLRGIFRRVVTLAKEEQPDAVVYIDYPGFNLRLAKVLHKAVPETKQIYYISPQVWAWKAGRAKLMEKLLDRLLVIFPFEKDWFAQRVPGLKVDWVGHPIWDRMTAQDLSLTPTLPRTSDDDPDNPLRVALLPGSREAELKKHLPILVRAARELRTRRQSAGHRVHFVWLVPDDEKLRLGRQLIADAGGDDLHIESYVGYSLSHLSRCDLALLASGTVSMEAACLGVPQIVFYKANPITYWIGRRVVKVRFLSMVNLLVDREVVPEYIQSDLDPVVLARHAAELLDDPERRDAIRGEMRHAVEKLGGPGASERAARSILDEIGVTPVTT